MQLRFVASRRIVSLATLLATLTLTGPVGADARVSYILHCGGCHLLDGSGTPPEVPGLRDLGKLMNVPGGRAYLVRVPGASQAPIEDDELTVIVNYILHEFNADTLPASFQGLTEQEVSQARGNTLEDPLKYREMLWQQLDY
ncbi:MAG: hypothetical protein RJQ07_02460 [Pseudomonadales bacterium]